MAMRVGFLSGVELRELSISRFRPKPMDGRYSSLPGVVNATVSLGKAQWDRGSLPTLFLLRSSSI
jgi:hypothetical protein